MLDDLDAATKAEEVLELLIGHAGDLVVEALELLVRGRQVAPHVHVQGDGLLIDLVAAQALPFLGLVEGAHGRGNLLEVLVVETLLLLESRKAALDGVRPCRPEGQLGADHAMPRDLDPLNRWRVHPRRRTASQQGESGRTALAVRRRGAHRQPRPATAGRRCRRVPEAPGGRQVSSGALHRGARHGRLSWGALREAPFDVVSCCLLHSFSCLRRLSCCDCVRITSSSATM